VALGVILERSAEDFSTKVFWIKFIAIWQQPLSTSITCFVLQYAGLGRWLNRRTYMLPFLIPLLCMLFMITNDFHHLIWTDFWMNRYVVSSRGRLYWVFNSYTYLLGFVNFVTLVRLAMRSAGHRLPVAIIVSCQIITRVVYTIDKLNAGLIGPGESVFLIVGVMSLAYAVAFLRFHVIDPVLAARTLALQQMREGFFVLDLQGCISDVNPVGAAILCIPEVALRHKRLGEVMPLNADILEKLENQEADQTEITLRRYCTETDAPIEKK
jgi:PAS domain-containing protein